MSKILIVEDDLAIATGLALNLKIEGHEADVVHDGEAALPALRAGRPDLVVLDISLPRKNGLQVLAEMRDGGDRTPVIILSARHDEFDKVAALRLGADDYVTKPFALAELLARVIAVLRRAGRPIEAAAGDHRLLHFSDVQVDLDTRVVTRAGAEVPMTPLEFDLLAFFLRRPAEVLARDLLLREVWGVRSGSARTVDNFVAQLRSKLEADPEHPRHLVTVRGPGYRFDA